MYKFDIQLFGIGSIVIVSNDGTTVLGQVGVWNYTMAGGRVYQDSVYISVCNDMPECSTTTVSTGTISGLSRTVNATSPDSDLEVGDELFSTGTFYIVADAPASAGGTNNLSFGSTAVSKMTVGSTEVSKVYVGSTLVYEKSENDSFAEGGGGGGSNIIPPPAP